MIETIFRGSLVVSAIGAFAVAATAFTYYATLDRDRPPAMNSIVRAVRAGIGSAKATARAHEHRAVAHRLSHQGKAPPPKPGSLSDYGQANAKAERKNPTIDDSWYCYPGFGAMRAAGVPADVAHVIAQEAKLASLRQRVTDAPRSSLRTFMISDRLAAFVQARHTPEPNCGCWLWTGHVNRAGYGVIDRGGRKLGAHRVSYEMNKGQIPHGLVVRHTCDVPSCVNPDHLLIGTQADNIQDAVKRNRIHRWLGHRRGTANFARNCRKQMLWRSSFRLGEVRRTRIWPVATAFAKATSP
jgi:hypothetical protein